MSLGLRPHSRARGYHPLLGLLHPRRIGRQSADAHPPPWGTGSNKSNAGDHINSTWITRADQEKFVLVLPNGTDATTGLSGSHGDFNWNDCRVGAGGAETTADDVGFLSKVIDDMIARESVNPIGSTSPEPPMGE
jgi:hypothetical protein